MSPAAIVIVTHNSDEVVGPCLDAALCASDEILVVDNASTDRTIQEVRKRAVRLIANATNRGFAAAVNQAVRSTQNPLILLLNPDAILQTGIGPLAQACAPPRIAAAAGLLLNSGGTAPQRGFAVRRLPTAAALAFESLGINRLWPSNPVNWHYRCCDLDLQSPQIVEQPAGALFLFRRDVWRELGGFDEAFSPIWFEDVDFCRRALDRGLAIRFVPSVTARHQGGHSVQKLVLSRRAVYWYGNLLKYAARHFRPGAFRMVCLSVVVGSILRMVMGIVSERSLIPVAAYGAVLRRAGRGFLAGPHALE